MLGTNFPISDYHKENILDAQTVARGGNWWTAILLIADPIRKKPFVAFYRWQNTDNVWKIQKQFSVRGKEQVEKIIAGLNRFLEKF